MSNQKLKNSPARGFTLLEVMVALAIMGLSLLYLFQAQTRSMRMAEKSRHITVATGLARKKLLDCKYDILRKGLSTADYKENGDFSDEGFEDIKWECFAYRFDMPPPSPDAIAQGIKAQGQGMPNMGGGGGAPGGGAGSDFTANMLAPFFGLISTTLGESVRELALIVRWKDGESDEEMKVVTHVIDRTAMARLAASLPDQPMLPPGFGPPGAQQPPGGQPPGGPQQPGQGPQIKP